MSYVLDALKKADAERERGAVPGLHAQPYAAAPSERRGGGLPGWGWAAIGGVAVLAALGAWRLWSPEDEAVRTAAIGAPASSAPVPAPEPVPSPAPAPAQASPGGATAVPPSVSPSPRAVATPGPAPVPGTGGTSNPTASARPAPPPAAAAPSTLPPASPTDPRSAGRTARADVPTVAPAPATTLPPVPPVPRAAPSVPAPTRSTAMAPATRMQTAAAPAGATASPATLPAERPDAAQDSRIPTLAELPEEARRGIPRLSVGGSIYSDAPSARFLIINGQIFHERDSVAADLTLEQIRLKAAVFRYKTWRFSISY